MVYFHTSEAFAFPRVLFLRVIPNTNEAVFVNYSCLALDRMFDRARSKNRSRLAMVPCFCLEPSSGKYRTARLVDILTFNCQPTELSSPGKYFQYVLFNFVPFSNQFLINFLLGFSNPEHPARPKGRANQEF